MNPFPTPDGPCSRRPTMSGWRSCFRPCSRPRPPRAGSATDGSSGSPPAALGFRSGRGEIQFRLEPGGVRDSLGHDSAVSIRQTKLLNVGGMLAISNTSH